MTKVELQDKLDKANQIIEGLMQQICDLNEQYSHLVTQEQYNALLKQYNDLKSQYDTLLQLYNRNKQKRHNERNAGRKPKLNDELIEKIHKMKYENGMTIPTIAEELNISVGLVHKALHTLYNIKPKEVL